MIGQKVYFESTTANWSRTMSWRIPPPSTATARKLRRAHFHRKLRASRNARGRVSARREVARASGAIRLGKQRSSVWRNKGESVGDEEGGIVSADDGDCYGDDVSVS